MANLIPSELAKLNSKTGQPRLEILYDLVKDKRPLMFHDGSFVEILDIEQALLAIRGFSGKPIKLHGISNGLRLDFTTSDLSKSAEFGGGSGAGCGSDQTRINESAQAVYCSAISRKEFIESTTGYKIESNIEEVLSLKPDWVKSSQLIAEHLMAKGLIDSTQTFHHGSEYVKELCLTAKRLIEQEGLSWNKDKWNPADIWAIRGEPKMNWPDIWSMNNSMIQLLRSGELVGISLKKVSVEPKHSECNVGESKPIIELGRYGTIGGASGDFFSSKKVGVEFTGGSSFGRTYDPLKNWSLEIEGKSAKHGKIGKGPVSGMFVASGHSPLPDHKLLLARMKSASEDFLGDFYHLYVSNPPYTIRVDEKSFNEKMSALLKTIKGSDYVYSKFIGSCFIDTIRQDGEIFGEIARYAMSQSSFSGPFLKVQEKTF